MRIELSEMRILAAVLFLSGTFLIAQNQDSKVDHLVVYKHERKLVLQSGGKEVRSYKIALGAEPVGPKTREGDHRTPEGVYVLDSQNSNSRFYKAFHISYPSRKMLLPPKNWVSVQGETSCCTDCQRDTHG